MLFVLVADVVHSSKYRLKVNGLIEKETLQDIKYKKFVLHCYDGRACHEKKKVKQ